MVLSAHLVTTSHILRVLQLLLFCQVECNNVLQNSQRGDCVDGFNECQKVKQVSPVCGTNGIQYVSSCHLKYQACVEGNNVNVGYTGQCHYQYLENEVMEGRKKGSSLTDSNSSISEQDDDSSDSEETQGEYEAGSGDDEDDGDDSNADDTTPKPNPPTFPPTDPANPLASFCAEKPGPLKCDCKFSPPPPSFSSIKFPQNCNFKGKCKRQKKLDTEIITPKIPEDGFPKHSPFPMTARMAVAFSCVGIVSASAIIGYMLYSRRIGRNRQRLTSVEARYQTEMTAKDIEKRSGSMQTVSTTSF